MSREKELYQEALSYLVGGGTTGGRYNAVFKQPLYLSHAKGSKLYDLDGNEYVEFHSSAGPIMFGYGNERLIEAAIEGMKQGAYCFYDGEDMVELAKHYCKIFPSAERVRIVNTGTEATIAALRLARAYTGRDLIIRMEGHFHGMHEGVWYNHNVEGKMDEIGEIETIPDGQYIPEAFCSLVKNVEFNDFEALERVVERYEGQVAAVIMEPISFNCGCYPARKDYLEKVRKLCTEKGIVLIFDEVICAFRFRPGSAQAYYGVTPDLTTIAKAIGGGFPIAAVVGKAEIMNMAQPVGKAGISGTYAGSIFAVKAALECAKMIQEPGFYDHIEEIGEMLYGGMNELMKKHGIPGHVRGMGARFAIYFGVEDPEDDYNWRTVKSKYRSDLSNFFIREMIQEGVYFHDYGMSPVPAHNGFGTAHTKEDIAFTLEKIDKVFGKMKQMV